MIEINESNITFESVYNSPYSPQDEEFKQANMLLLPYHNFREGVEYCFSEYAEEILQYVRKNGSEELKTDIAITDEKYQIIEMHSMLLDLGLFIVQNVLIPMAVSILANFIYDKVKSLHKDNKEVNVRVRIISQDTDGKSKEIRYDGSADEFDMVIKAAEKLK